VETVMEQLEASIGKETEAEENPALLQPGELIQHIDETHHAYLRSELPCSQAMAERVAKAYGGHTPSLVEVYRIHCCMAEELASHMMREEEILFPAIKKFCAGESNNLPLDGPVAYMLQEHEDAGAAMAELRKLPHGFTPPAGACNTYRALFAGLAELEGDLHRHIHLENSVLLPKALALGSAN
jgi:regulator of cell morphogenesis and NO signaling